MAAFNLLSILVSSLIGVILMVLTGCLKPGEILSNNASVVYDCYSFAHCSHLWTLNHLINYYLS